MLHWLVFAVLVQSSGFSSTDLQGLQSCKSINQDAVLRSFGLLPKVIPPLVSAVCPPAPRAEARLSPARSPAGAEIPNTRLLMALFLGVFSALRIIILTGFFLFLFFFLSPCVKLQHFGVFYCPVLGPRRLIRWPAFGAVAPLLGLVFLFF